jgi:hypothetical protein
VKAHPQKHLYWVTTRDHDEDCFVVARSPQEASDFFEGYEGFNPGDSKARFVDVVPFRTTKVGYAKVHLLKRLGFKVVATDDILIVARSGETFEYGDVNYKAFLANLPDQAGVYVIRSSGSNFYKAGYSSRVLQRLCKLQTGNPYRLHLVMFIPTKQPRGVEREIHGFLRTFRSNFEWYEIPAAKLTEFKDWLSITAAKKWRTPFHQYHMWSP